jgi:quinolinate synthase
MSVEAVYEEMAAKLSNLVPDVELRIKAELVYKIRRLKKEKDAVILGHNYMEPALFYTIPDFKGDSLYLSRKSAETDKPIIVFCGVRFMAETAKILNPSKTVLLPSEEAGCSLAASITVEDVRDLKRRYPGVPVVTYVNTYADIKAESDICCTSSNAAQVVQSLESNSVIFIPDEYLAGNVAKELGLPIIYPDLSRPHQPGEFENGGVIIGWRGRCEVHEQFTVQDILDIRQQYPQVEVLSHPECSPEVVAASDFSDSTSAMIRHVETSQAHQYLMLTECAMGDNVAAANPDKEMLRLCMVRCPHMNMITLEDTLLALEKNQYVIEVSEDIRRRALKSVERMTEIG